MTKKTVPFARPAKKPDADSWVAAPRDVDTAETSSLAEVSAPAEPMKRFTIDVPESLHKRIKITCAQRGSRMADEIREILAREFPET
jgi:hypothetical protein